MFIYNANICVTIGSIKIIFFFKKEERSIINHNLMINRYKCLVMIICIIYLSTFTRYYPLWAWA